MVTDSLGLRHPTIRWYGVPTKPPSSRPSGLSGGSSHSRYIEFDICSNNGLNISISEEEYIEIDTIFVQCEIDGHISDLDKNIKMIENYISTK